MSDNRDRALVIGVGAFQVPGLEFLKSKGYFIVGVDGAQNPKGKAYCDLFYHKDLNNTDELLKIAKKEKISFAIAFECDPAVAPMHVVNSELGLPSLNKVARTASLDKLLVRKVQKELGLNRPIVHEIESLERLQKSVNESDHYWVLKPIASSGSRGVQLISKNSDLLVAYKHASQMKRYENESLLLEEFIEGKEIAIDGFCHQGDCHVLTISFKDRTYPPYLLDTGLLISADPTHPLAMSCQKQLSKLFTALQPGLSTPYHAEFLYNDRGVYLVEFSFRGAGFNVFSRLIPLVTGFDTLGFSVDQITNPRPWPQFSESPHNMIYLGFFDGRDGVLKKVHLPSELAENPLVHDFKVYVTAGDTTRQLQSGADRLGHIVLLGTEKDSLRSEFLRIKESVRFVYE